MAGRSTLLVNMNDHEEPRTATQSRHLTTADWWDEPGRELRWVEVDPLAEPKDGDEFI